MEISQLYYLIKIVESDYNLSLAAKNIHISQPALSQFISTFEKDNEVELFNRKNGRLQNMTEAGKNIYDYAIKILELYEEMEDVIRIESEKQKGATRIGLPSMILETYFADYFPKIQIKHPDAHLSIIEAGSHELRKKLMTNEIDIAILIEPTNLEEDTYEQHIIEIDEIVAFIRKDHPLSQKEILYWKDLNKFPLATFHKKYMTNQLITDKLKLNQLETQIVFTSDSWGYLIGASYETDIVSILPRPIEQYLTKEHCVRHFKDYIPFNFSICRPVKDKYKHFENYIYQDIIKTFYRPLN